MDKENEPTSDPSSLYHAYLLRLWQEAPGAPRRILLESVRDGQRRPFANLESLFVYLDRIAHGDGEQEK